MLNEIQDLAKTHGIHVSYEIVNQAVNGFARRVLDGTMTLVTYTVYVDTAKGDQLAVESFDHLDKALKRGIELAREYLNATTN